MRGDQREGVIACRGAKQMVVDGGPLSQISEPAGQPRPFGLQRFKGSVQLGSHCCLRAPFAEDLSFLASPNASQKG